MILPFFKSTREFFPSPGMLCRNSVHGSRASPRTEFDVLKINKLAVRPEPVEGRMANYNTASLAGGNIL
jgi:hypothetical protein